MLQNIFPVLLALYFKIPFLIFVQFLLIAVSNPCNHDLCAEEAMCVVRSREDHRCICPDGMVEVKRRGGQQNNVSASDGISSVSCRPAAAATTASPTKCPLNCLKGECKFSPPDGFKCRCDPLYEGKLCDKYRCSQYCKNKGFCVIDTLAPTGPDGQKPIMVSTPRQFIFNL